MFNRFNFSDSFLFVGRSYSIVMNKVEELVSGLILPFVFAVSIFSPAISATTVVETNVARVAVDDQSTRTQNQAVKEALKIALIKLSGRPDIGEYQQVQDLVANARQYLRSYQFNEENGQLWYVAEFDLIQLESFIRESTLPLWGQRRPDTLLWLAIEDGQGDRYLLGEGSGELSHAIHQYAERRGIPLALPLLDLTDSQALTMYDVWGLFVNRIQAASSRYGSDFVMGGRLFKTQSKHMPTLRRDDTQQAQAYVDRESAFGAGDVNDMERYFDPEEEHEESGPAFTAAEFKSMQSRARKGRFGLEWVYTSNEGVKTDVIYGDSRELLIEKLITHYADFLGQQFAILPYTPKDGAAVTLAISVSNLDALPKYVSALNYLSGLSVTDKVALSQQKGSVATFTVTLLGSEKDFLNVLSLDTRLSPVVDALGQPIDGLNFYWNE